MLVRTFSFHFSLRVSLMLPTWPVAIRPQLRRSLLPSFARILLLDAMQGSQGLDGMDQTLVSTTFNAKSAWSAGVVRRRDGFRNHWSLVRTFEFVRARAFVDVAIPPCSRRHSLSPSPPWTHPEVLTGSIERWPNLLSAWSGAVVRRRAWARNGLARTYICYVPHSNVR